MRDAVGGRRFGQKTAAEDGGDRDQRQPRIFAHEKAQAIRQLDLLDLARRCAHTMASRVVVSVPFGLSEMTVRLSGVRYLLRHPQHVALRYGCAAFR